jgi:hypothetical protein
VSLQTAKAFDSRRDSQIIAPLSTRSPFAYLLVSLKRRYGARDQASNYLFWPRLDARYGPFVFQHHSNREVIPVDVERDI